MTNTQDFHLGGDLSELAGKHLTFQLQDQHYALPILQVREIVGLLPVTTIPQAPECLRGVVNLRGQVIGVVDLATVLGLSPAPDSDRTCVIVTETWNNGVATSIGLVVDQVSEVLHLETEDLQELTDSVTGVSRLIEALAKIGDDLLMLLNLEHLIDHASVTQHLESSALAPTA